MLRRFLIRAGSQPQVRKAAEQLFRLPLLGPACRRLASSLVPRGQRAWIQIPRGPAKGMWMKVEPYWEPGYVGGVPEPGVPAMIEEFLKPGDCFYDVGAHVGFYSLLAAKLVGETGHVLALEPDADNVAVLNEVVARNNLKNVRIAHAAVWDADGEVSFERGLDSPSRMGGRVAEASGAQQSPGEMVTVPAVALDTLASGNRPPTLIKIDVEGGEKQVLQGAQRILQTHNPVLVIEIHDQKSTDEVVRMLSAWGYTQHSVHPTGVKVHACFKVQRP